MSVVRAVNRAVRFLLELCALAALGYWGFHAGSGAAERIALAIGLPAVAAVVRGVFGAPGSARRLHGLWRLGLELVILGGAVAGLFAAGQQVLALVFAVVVVVNEILLYSLGQGLDLRARPHSIVTDSLAEVRAELAAAQIPTGSSCRREAVSRAPAS